MTGRDCTWQLLASREEVALVGLAVDDDADDVQRKQILGDVLCQL